MIINLHHSLLLKPLATTAGQTAYSLSVINARVLRTNFKRNLLEFKPFHLAETLTLIGVQSFYFNAILLVTLLLLRVFYLS